MRSLVSAALVCAIFFSQSGADAQKAKRSQPVLRPPSPANRFVTVVEFQRARRAAGANVSIEGYVVLAEKSGSSTVRLSLVDSTDKVLNAREAKQAARAGAPCTATMSAKQRPGWTMTRKGFLRLAMYATVGKKCVAVNDAPPKVRIQGSVGRTRAAIATVTKVEYHDEDGEWRELN